MNRQEAKSLVQKYNRGLATAQEKARLENWYQLKSAQLKLDDGDIDFEQIAAALRTNTYQYAGLIDPQITASPAKTKRLWPRVAAIAAVLAFIVFGLWFYTFRQFEGGQSKLGIGVMQANDIAPGKNTATLTLANGKNIQLSDTKTGLIIDANSLLYNDGTVAGQGDPKAIASLTITTPRGGTYQVRLPDGSKVWLNAASSLTYSAAPHGYGGLRKVRLNGEAYFEVFKNKDQPFVVNSQNQEVTVLGTHFNISSYADEGSVKTTLLEGSVNVSRSPDKSGINKDPAVKTLKPGQQSIVSNQGFKVVTANLDETIAWKDGYFRFYEVDLQTFMNTIARWYDIEVDYEGGIDQYKDLAFGGSVSRSKNISEVLKILAQTGKVHYKIEGRKVTITL